MTAATLDVKAAVRETWDVIVLGAGPAGALAARQVARGGARVLLVDQKTFPRDKVCGACLNGRALAQLGAVGLASLVSRAGAVGLDAFELRVGGRMVRLALPRGAALSRARFDAALVDAAVAAGAQFLPGIRATVEAGTSGGVRHVRLAGDACASGRIVLAATGLAGACLAHEPSVRTAVAAGSRIGAGCTLDGAPNVYAPGTIHMAVGRGGYVGLVRIEDGRINIAAALDPARVRALGAAGAAAAAMAEAGFAPIPAMGLAAWRGTAALTCRISPVAAPRLFILGDAAGYVEPFTGEGMAWALAAGAAAAPLALRASERWEPDMERQWAALFRRQVARGQALCRGLALVLRHPQLAAAALPWVDRMPRVTARLLRRLNAPRVIFEATPS